MSDKDPFIADLEKAGYEAVRERIISHAYADERLRKAEAWLQTEAEKRRNATQVASLEVAQDTRDAAWASAEASRASADEARAANEIARQANEFARQANERAITANKIASKSSQSAKLAMLASAISAIIAIMAFLVRR